MSQPLEGDTDVFIIKEAELRQVIGVARYLCRVNLQIRNQLIEFKNIYEHKGDRIVSAGFLKLKFDELCESVQKGLKEFNQSHPEIDSRNSGQQKREAPTQIDNSEIKRIKRE